MFSRPEAFLRFCHRRYGGCFTVKAAGLGTYVYLTDPADIRAVFRADADTFHAGEANGLVLASLLGPASVLVTDGEVHRRQRRLMMPAFHGNAVARLASTMAAIAAADIDAWPVRRPFPVAPRMRQITLEVILRAVIGADDPVRLAGLRAVLPPLVDLNLFNVLPFAFPALAGRGPWKRYQAVAERADAALRAEIAHSKQDPALGRRTDVLAMLIRARDADGSAMTDSELRDQLVTLLLAGHETTATALAWALERLIRHPAALDKAQRAAREDDAGYLDAIVAETLRVRPVVPDISRRLTRPAQVGGYLLPAGIMVDPAIPLVQRAAEHYPRPLEFDPGRFAGRPPDPLVWLPFGGGTRRCLGAAFACTEMRIVLAEVLRRTELQTTAARAEPAKVRHVTLVPGHGARITINRRVPTRRTTVGEATASTTAAS
jgi:cytochrome P450